MLLAVQYYRPPFPSSSRWEDDLDRIAASGIEAIQLWVTWGWVEPAPGELRFEDYDRLMDLAHERGLRVVLSTIAEVQPFWVPRVLPDAAMINHLGQPVVSTPRRENNAGITPGGCWDHPDLLERIGGFLRETATHFAAHPALLTWDVWNETRWSIHADSLVCYCEHSLARFRSWLAERHGGLDGLNEAWQRRYTSWDDVMPGTVPGRMYTEVVEFQRFLTWRAGEHMRFRAESVRAGDGERPVGGHCINPSAYAPGVLHEQALHRGNDWDHVTSLDSYGLSMYPDLFVHDPADLGGRLTAARSASGTRPLWVCELEAAPTGVGLAAGRPVGGRDVRRWLWSSVAHGARAAILWQWYDELVGPEAAAFGLSGDDGNAAERLDAVADVAATIGAHRELVDAYAPEPGRVAVVFDQGGYALDWAEHGAANDLVSGSVHGYVRALERTGTPYRVLHAGHLTADRLDGVRLVVLPAPLVVAPQAAAVLAAWVRDGGTLLTETEVDAWSEEGFYRYPGERPFAAALGIRGHGRRPAGTAPVEVTVDGEPHTIATSTWTEPVGAADDSSGAPEPSPRTDDDAALTSTFRRPLGRGAVVAVGTFAGHAAAGGPDDAFDAFVAALVREAGAGGDLPVVESSDVLVRTGSTRDGHLVFVANHTDRDGRARLRLPAGVVHAPVGLVGDEAATSVDDGILTCAVLAGESHVVHLRSGRVMGSQVRSAR